MIKLLNGRLGASALAAAVLTVSGLATAPAFADVANTPAPPAAAPVSPEGELLGRHIAASGFDDLGALKPFWGMTMAIASAQMKATANKNGGIAVLAYDRFGPWGGYFVDASAEEFHADRARYEQIVGHWLAQKYTVEELQAVSDLCDSPAGKEFPTQMMGAIGSMGSKSSGASMSWSPQAKAAIDHFQNSPGGKAFKARTEAMFKGMGAEATKVVAATKGDTAAKDAEAKALLEMLQRDPQTTEMIFDLTATWVPGTMRRFGEKAEAAEKARVAGMTPPPPPSH